MKLAFEVDIDLFEENEQGFSLKETIENKIVTEVINRCYKVASEKIEVQISSKIMEQVEKKSNEVFDDFMNRPIVVTDRYGDPVETGTIKTILKSKFDKWNDEKVDERGSVKGYGANKTRLEWLIESQLMKYGDEFVKKAVKEVSTKLETTLTDNLRDMIGKKIAEKIGLNKLLAQK